MRQLLVLAALLTGAAPAAASAASDRYGDARPASGQIQGAAPPGFRSLTWANKSDTLQTPDVAPRYAAPEPMALAGQYLRGRTAGGSGWNDLPPPPGERSRAAVYATGYQPFTPQEPYRAPQAPSPSPPAPQAAGPSPAPAPGLPTSLYAPPPADAAIGRPQQIAQAAPAPTPLSAPPAGGVGEGARLYSVHRSYGLDPDAIPAPHGDAYVLIGPPDSGSSGSGLAGGPPSDDDNAPKDGQPF